MREDLLHYVWRLKKFVLDDLRTTDGEVISIHQFGHLNTHAGPDFLNARISIGDTEWAGNVEMHLKSSDWIKHKHSEDDAYNNVVLHVVYEEDAPIMRATGEKIPCLELKRRIPKKIQSQYLRLIYNEKRIPCEGATDEVASFTWKLWLERLAIERLEEKVAPINQGMKLTLNNREEVFYHFVAKNFGVKVNAEPFERLARSISLLILSKHQGNLFQIEALLFGQAGMLNREFVDKYPNELKKEYEFLRAKYNLTPIHFSEWKYLRLRPANFPTIRIAQFSALVFKSQRLFSRILWVKNQKQIEELFDVGVSEYWKSHYVFDKESSHRNKNIGNGTIRLITINTIVPFLFHYGKEKKEEAFVDKALMLLNSLKAESNQIITMWKDLGIKPDNAAQSQALLQLKNNYCKHKKCLQCMIGNSIIGKQQSITKKK